jgi:hypothetical protein
MPQPLLLGLFVPSEYSDLAALTKEGRVRRKWLQGNAWDDAVSVINQERNLLGELRRVEFARKPALVRKAIMEENAPGIRKMVPHRRDELENDGELFVAMFKGALDLTEVGRHEIEKILLDYIEINGDVSEGPSVEIKLLCVENNPSQSLEFTALLELLRYVTKSNNEICTNISNVPFRSTSIEYVTICRCGGISCGEWV